MKNPFESFVYSLSLELVLTLLQAISAHATPAIQLHSRDSASPSFTASSTAYPLFQGDKPNYDDISQGSTGNSNDDPSSSFGTVLSLLTYLNVSSIKYLFDDVPPSTDTQITNVKLYILENEESVKGGTKTYGINYNQALGDDVGLLSYEKRVGWPAVLRSAILQHHIPNLSGDTLNKGDTLSKDYMRALSGMDHQVSQFSTLENEIWTTWRYFSPKLYPYIFQSTSTAQKLKPDLAYGVFSVNEGAQTIDLYHPSPEIGKLTYAWQDIKSDLNLLSWREDLKVINEENRLSGGNGSDTDTTAQ
ncbi:hypothetical protein I302_106844 [Kwoniella bestiolae CBS 10118]|uniref:Uncharacterized protein n=1 Tax=Kwoniella bestiolae CBS 10118 TaxID=1296100 RepID=A0A1B9G082_9TREE|nr:hypothetical protein I302_05891 [Kwoniella bestiolae CBS 10118]OCF24431.1 hypothetical protein I302_05891 [Kwoniella bestiolae CBS 10118]